MMKLSLKKRALKNLSNKSIPKELTALPAGGTEDINFTNYANCNTQPSDPRICWSGGQTK